MARTSATSASFIQMFTFLSRLRFSSSSAGFPSRQRGRAYTRVRGRRQDFFSWASFFFRGYAILIVETRDSHVSTTESRFARLYVAMPTIANCIFFKKICHKFRPRRHNIYEGIIPPLAQSGGRYVQRVHITRQIAGHSMRVLRASKHRNPLWTQLGLW